MQNLDQHRAYGLSAAIVRDQVPPALVRKYGGQVPPALVGKYGGQVTSALVRKYGGQVTQTRTL